MIALRIMLGAYIAMTAAPPSGEFTLAAPDGTELHGVVDRPSGKPIATVVMSSGTGLFDRDVRFGRSGTDRDLLFKDLSQRLTAAGLQVVRFDRRGVNYGNPTNPIDWKVSGQITNASLRDDLGTVYDWVRARDGLAATCVVVLGHSEGMATIGRLAQTGRPAPALLAGFGALLESPKSVLKWQMTERDVTSLLKMDADHNGVTTNDEVRTHWRETPSSAFDMLEPFLNPAGSWDRNAIARVGSAQFEVYQKMREEVLAADDSAPYPNAQRPLAAYSWWKSWFADNVPVAKRLQAWRTKTVLFYGDRDSQTPADRQIPLAREYLGDQAKISVLPGLGHSLGDHALFGPIDEKVGSLIASAIANEASGRCKSK